MCYNFTMKNTKKDRSLKTTTSRPTAKDQPAPVKRPRGRPPKIKTDAPAPPPPVDNLKILEALLLRLVSPLKSLPVQTNEAVVYIRPEDIAFVTTSPPPKRGVIIVTVDGREWRRFDSIKDIKDSLAADPRFFLAHKSYLVNVFAIRGLRRDPENKRQEVTFGDQVKTAAAVSSGNLKALRDLIEL